MQDWLDGLAGPGYTQAILWTFAALLLLVIVLVIVKLVRSLTFGTFVAGGRNRKTRLAVMDATAVDSHRRLVLAAASAGTARATADRPRVGPIGAGAATACETGAAQNASRRFRPASAAGKSLRARTQAAAAVFHAGEATAATTAAAG
jgi:hypothetical protein